MYMYMYIRIHIYIRTYIPTHAHIYTYIHTYIHTHTHTHTHMYITGVLNTAGEAIGGGYRRDAVGRVVVEDGLVRMQPSGSGWLSSAQEVKERENTFYKRTHAM